MNKLQELICTLANAPSGIQVDIWLRTIFFEWHEKTPRLIDIITIRNEAAYTSACSDFIITCLNVIIENYEELVK